MATWRHMMNIMLWFLPPSRLFGLRRICMKSSGIDVAASVQCCGRGWVYGRGCLSIDSGTWISPGAIFYTHVEAAISIGSNCDIGPDVTFVTGTHVIGASSRRAGVGRADAIKVGDGCWIGARCLILGGVSIGDGAVVAAGAVVVKDVPSGALVAGVPARVKRMLPA